MTTRIHVAALAAIAAAMATGACSMSMNDHDTTGAAAMATAAEHTTMVGGAAMYPSRTIIQNAVNSADHTTLVAAVRAAGLVETLQGAGPFTVFAPTNAAFDKLPAGAVETLVQPTNRQTLTTILTYHVIAGRLTSADLVQRINAGGGRATLTTVQGGTLTATRAGNSIALTDAAGGRSTVTIADVIQSNGVIHVVDTVLMPSRS